MQSVQGKEEETVAKLQKFLSNWQRDPALYTWEATSQATRRLPDRDDKPRRFSWQFIPDCAVQVNDLDCMVTMAHMTFLEGTAS